MKIAIIADSIDNQYAGVLTYAKELIDAVLDKDKKNEYLFVHLRPNNFFTGRKERIIPDIAWIPCYGLFRKFFLIPFCLKRYHVDIVHDLSHTAPFFLPFGKYKKILTVHDCTPLLFPTLHPFRSVLWHRLFWKTILSHADQIIAVSPDTKNDLISLFPFTKKKISVISLAPPKQKSVHKISPSEIQTRGELMPYILFVGTIEPRKNLTLLIEVFEKLHFRYHIPHHLVLVGKRGWHTGRLQKQIRGSPLATEICQLGYVDISFLHSLYTHADIFVYPSLYEGFGLPILEAMQTGCPVIASNVPGIRTTAGNGALLFESNSVEDLISALYTVLMNTASRKRLIVQGKRTARMYSWEKTAHETIQLYHSL